MILNYSISDFYNHYVGFHVHKEWTCYIKSVNSYNEYMSWDRWKVL